MKIYSDLQDFSVTKPIVTIGTFDGIHLGHRSVIDDLLSIAKTHKGESVIFTFDPHPRQVVFPNENKLRLLTTPEEKTALMSELGVDHLVIYPFTSQFASMDYHEFVRDILVKKMHLSHLVIGYDHRFGKNREGSFEFLSTCASQLGFGITQLQALEFDHINISSTKIRNALEKGDILTANEFLGYSYQLTGNVVKGDQLGRTIGFPTANIQASHPDKLIPGHGVYAVNVKVEGAVYQGMLNIGTRPTVSNADRRSIEVHIFNFSKDIYDKAITLYFEQKIRDERRFDNIYDLKNQLEADKIVTQKLLNGLQ
ncbi:MAG: bifunctional riboflavin kinase/FAD synthetase [Bacteroidota bacterium]|nr:bifunctional riboflavin kinase/FAD synthetase [Bacteroidota bacterium]